jgi:arylsulfatase A-like enzyme
MAYDMTNRCHKLIGPLVVVAALASIAAPVAEIEASEAADRPNIVVILADDMGYSDIGCYGGEIETPHLDELAANGLLFTQFYNTARCCPTRASLLTGLHPHQTGIGWMTSDPEDKNGMDQHEDGYRGFLNRKCVTIAEVLRPAGYQTLMVGKWHVGYAKQEFWPLARGFDRYFGVLAGAASYFKPAGNRGLTEGNESVAADQDTFYLTDRLTDRAIDFVDEANRDSPFFLYVAYTAPHWPLQAPEEVVAKYRDKYTGGWDALRSTRYKRMKELGIVEDEWKLPPRGARAWDKLGPEKQQEMAERMAIYAAQVDRMDQNIGRLVEALRSRGELDNTLLMFLSDNGGCAEGGDLGGGRRDQLNQADAGLFVTYGRCWANASNTPFRRYKHFTHEGGIATPLVVHWPDRIDEHGSFRNQPGYLPDLMATFVDVSGTTYPTEHAGNAIPSMEGISLTAAFRDEPAQERLMFWEHERHRAVRKGDWKAVSLTRDGPWELYDLKADRTELNNLAEEKPELVSKLAKAWDEWSWRVHVQPYPTATQE